MIPTAIWPMMLAWMVLAETHFARDRKKKKEMIIRISTTRLNQLGRLNNVRGVGAFKHTSRFVVGKEASGHGAVRWELSRATDLDQIPWVAAAPL